MTNNEMINEMALEYKKMFSSCAKILSYCSKLNESTLNADELESFLKINSKFKRKVKHINNLLERE